MNTLLSVNLNAIAQLRNRRDLPWPSVVALGRQAMQAGAHGLTVHPRPDQRHIRFNDLPPLRDLLDQEFPDAEFNIEGYPTPHFLELVEANRPDQVTLVPDDPSQSTSDHGWDFTQHAGLLKETIVNLKSQGFRVSIFVDAEPSAMPQAFETGTDRVELYTGPYGACYDDNSAAEREAASLAATAVAAMELGMAINAGHDLTVENLPLLKKEFDEISEVSIGHGLTALALECGMTEAVKRFLSVLS